MRTGGLDPFPKGVRSARAIVPRGGTLVPSARTTGRFTRTPVRPAGTPARAARTPVPLPCTSVPLSGTVVPPTGTGVPRGRTVAAIAHAGPPFIPGQAAMNPAAPVDVHTPGEYTFTEEFRMHTTAQTIKTTTLAIDGMSCGHCVQAVTKALSGVPGVTVKSVAVGSAVIQTADGWTTDKAVAALDEAGYAANAMGESAGSVAPMPAKRGGSCCGGAKAATTNGQPGAKNSGGCCG